MTTAGMTYEKAACRYCADQISTNSLARHEADCQNATPELREERKLARERADRQRQHAAPTTVGKQHTIPCHHCGDLIGAGSLLRHEQKCETRTPQEREYSKQQRHYQQTHYDKLKKSEDNRARYQASLRVPSKLDKPVVPDVAPNGSTPMKNPMSISMLVDKDDFALALGRVVISKLPELLPQLIPGLTIEAFTTKGHRAGKV